MELTVLIQRLESAAIAVAVTIAFVHLDFSWWWLLVLFLAFDLSALGYLLSPAIGAVTYNAVHSYIVPAAIIGWAIAADVRWAFFVALAWAFHIAVDRLLGYGLKFTDSFHHTHLGAIGRQ